MRLRGVAAQTSRLPDAARAYPRLVEVWEALVAQGGGVVPDRQSVDPLGLPAQHLPYLFLLDVWPDHAVFRLVGTALCERAGCELKGRQLTALVQGEDYRAAWIDVRRCVDEQVPVFAERDVTITDRRPIHFVRLLIPLRRLDEDFRTLFGAVIPLDFR